MWLLERMLMESGKEKPGWEACNCDTWTAHSLNNLRLSGWELVFGKHWCFGYESFVVAPKLHHLIVLTVEILFYQVEWEKNKTPNFSQLPLILRYTEMSFVLPSIHLWETSPPTLLYFMNRHHVSGNNSCGRHLLLRSSLIVVEAVWFQSQWLYSGFLMQWCMIVTGTSFFGSGNCWEL